jgi:hypothetical protein
MLHNTRQMTAKFGCILVSIKTRYLVLEGLNKLTWDLAIVLVQHKEFHNVVFFLLGDYRASEFYVPTFRNILFHLHRSFSHDLWSWNRQNVPKRRYIKFTHRGITQKIHNTAKIWNQVFRNALWDIGLVLMKHREFHIAFDLRMPKRRTCQYYA